MHVEWHTTHVINTTHLPLWLAEEAVKDIHIIVYVTWQCGLGGVQLRHRSFTQLCGGLKWEGTREPGLKQEAILKGLGGESLWKRDLE